MISRTLAWSSLGLVILFMVATLASIFAGASLGEPAATIAFWVGVGSLSVAILLSLLLLAFSALSSDP